MRAPLALFVLLLLALGAIQMPVQAQQLGVVKSDVLVIDIERLLAETAYGQRLQAELEAEEKALTELRATTPPAEFRDKANAFDTKVTQLRRESEQLSRDFERQRDLAPVQFMRVVQPVLGDLLREAEAAVLVDVRSVILRADVVDVTDVAISRIDAGIGSGPEVRPSPTGGQAPDTPVPDAPAPDLAPDAPARD